MILYYNARNFASFKDDFEFTMKPIKFMERFEDNIISIDSKLNLSKFAVIFGENTGGKTSFFRSLHFLKFCILEAKQVSMLSQLSHRHDLDNSQSFEICILADRKIYTYKLEIDEYSIIYESLEVRDINQRVSSNKVVFATNRSSVEIISDNEGNEDEFGLEEDIKIQADVFINKTFIPKEIHNTVIKSNGLANGSFVNYLYKLNIDITIPFIEWFEEKLILELPENISLNLYKSIESDIADLKIMKTKEYLEILQLIDSSICGVELSKSKIYEKTVIKRALPNNEEFEIKLEDESSGMQAFFAWAVQIWKVIYTDSVLFADEIDSVLNPIMSSKIISYLKGSEHKGQFIFSTHNIMNLNTRDFMKEQIYFISKDADTLSSKMYSLKDFKNYRYEKTNVYELYMKGILGGVPNS